MTHCHLVCHKGQVKVLCVDMLLNDTVHLLDKHTVKTTQMRFIIRHIRLRGFCRNGIWFPVQDNLRQSSAVGQQVVDTTQQQS